MSILYEERCYRLEGLTPLLGSQPANEAIFTMYLAQKAPNINKAKQEARAIDGRGDTHDDPPGSTVFLRDMDAVGAPICISDHVVRGFFKAAGRATAKHLGLTMVTSKIDRYLFVVPRFLHIKRDTGEVITDADGWLERPIRINDRAGERVALACSEKVGEDGEPTPWVIDLSLMLLENEGTKTSAPLDWEAVESMLDYGRFCGLGQWRNGGYGRFSWKLIGEGTECRPQRKRAKKKI